MRDKKFGGLLNPSNEEFPTTSYLDFLVLTSSAADLAAVLARVEDLKTLFGLRALRILKTVHAVPMACPAASSPSFAALPACSPYLQDRHTPKFTHYYRIINTIHI